ncbi:MAG: helix-turn-helix transcriptional regulator [Clostridia bacterium]|nr:helix-turn-helix transcriptional regulator [Clostridia bacterium]
MDIFIRYIAKTDYLPNKFPTKAYDSRILYILDGKGEMRFADKAVTIKKGAFCYYPPGTEYYPVSSAEAPLKFIVVNFDFSTKNKHISAALPPVASADYDPSMAVITHTGCGVDLFMNHFVISNAYFLNDLMETVEEEFKKHTVHAAEIAAAYLKCALLKLTEFKNQKENELYNKIIGYIDSNYKTIKDNRQIAQALNYHPYYINNVIKQHSGITLHRYLTKIRLAKACEMLTFTKLSISEISKEIGFDNPNQFSNIFSKEYGASPSAYRKSLYII